MNRLELIDKIVAKHEISKAEAGRILATIVEEIIETVKKDDPLTIIGFGTFKLQERPQREGRNPATGETITIPAAKVPKFVPGANFKKAVNCKKCCKAKAKAKCKK